MMNFRHVLNVSLFIIGVVGVDVWCGKAYKAEDPAFDPGGWLSPPPTSDVPLLNFNIYSRMNVYLEDEHSASIIVDAEVTNDVGVPLPYCEKLDYLDFADLEHAEDNIYLILEIRTTELGSDGVHPLMHVRSYIPLNSTNVEIYVPVSKLPPRFEPYEIEASIAYADCYQDLVARTNLYRLPLPKHGGSVTRLEYLCGGLQTRREDGKWKEVFPFGFYVDWGGYLIKPENQDEYASREFSILSPVPAGGDVPFEPDEFAAYVARLDKASAVPSMMYNMRWTYQKQALVTTQVEKLKKHDSLLLWYTADEPGGQGDPLDAPLKSYDTIRRLDPYHPVAVVLNCANFHYAEYTRGVDIILTDPYPIAVNTSFSSRWHTPCNTTYGCCGCDNCAGNFRDITTRLDNFARFTRWLSNAPLGSPSKEPGRNAGGPKSFWFVPQVFGGSEYWIRPPTIEEEIVMIWLGMNHGATGVIGWLYPTTPELMDVMSALAKVVTGEKVTELLLGDNPRMLEVETDEDVDVDAAAWVVGEKMLVSIVYLGLENSYAPVRVKLPYEVDGECVQQLWPLAEHHELGAREAVLGEAKFDFGGSQIPLAAEGSKSQTTWHINGSEAKRIGHPAMSVTILLLSLAE